MASSPVKFFSVFLVASAVGWVVFTFASRMLAWFLSRVMSASVSFRVAGFNCLRDVHIKFRKGSIESASVGEIKLSFRKSLVKLGVSVISKDPKLQLLISDIELVMRPSGQSKETAKSRKSRSTGKGKWFVITSAARFLSVWVMDLVVKVPKAGIEVKELKLDIFKIAGPNQSLEVKLHVVPLSLQLGDYGFGTDPVCHNQPDCSQSDQAFPLVSEKSPALFVCDDVMATCNFGHEKEKGVRIKNLDLTCGDFTATMTSRQFQVMLDVLSNLLFARLPKPQKSSLVYLSEDDEDVEEEADEVVPDGVEGVELARINLEQRERERKLLLDDTRTLCEGDGSQVETCTSSERDSEGSLWMGIGGKPALVQALKKEHVSIRKSRKAASSALRKSLQKAAQVRLMEKEKNKSPSCAMRISMRIKKVVWSMLADGKTFAETEINDMAYDFDRDYKDIGVAHFTTKSFVVRNCLPNAKSDMLLSAWNPPPEWGKNVMLCVDAKQGAPKDGHSPLDLFQVEIFPLKIYLTETMYRMMWDYFFPEEEQDSQRRQEVWRVSTSAGARKMRKSFAGSEGASTSAHSTKDNDVPGRLSSTGATSSYSNTRQSGSYGENFQVSKLQSLKANMVCVSNPELRRSSSADKNLEENVAENGTGDLILQLHSSSVPSKGVSANPTAEQFHAFTESSKNIRTKDSNRSVRAGRLSHEEKKFTKPQEEKRARSRKLMEFHNIKISQVELQVTYEGSRFAVNDLRLLMDTFHRAEFTGTWRRLFSKVKKHIIWGVLKSVTEMQGKKFKDKAHNQADPYGGTDLNLSDSDGGPPGSMGDQFPVSWLKRPSDLHHS